MHVMCKPCMCRYMRDIHTQKHTAHTAHNMKVKQCFRPYRRRTLSVEWNAQYTLRVCCKNWFCCVMVSFLLFKLEYFGPFGTDGTVDVERERGKTNEKKINWLLKVLYVCVFRAENGFSNYLLMKKLDKKQKCIIKKVLLAVVVVLLLLLFLIHSFSFFVL